MSQAGYRKRESSGELPINLQSHLQMAIESGQCSSSLVCLYRAWVSLGLETTHRLRHRKLGIHQQVVSGADRRTRLGCAFISFSQQEFIEYSLPSESF